jgi:hypothetical protein
MLGAIDKQQCITGECECCSGRFGMMSLKLSRRELREMEIYTRMLPPDVKTWMSDPNTGDVVEMLLPEGIRLLAQIVGGEREKNMLAILNEEQKRQKERHDLLREMDAEAAAMPPRIKMPQKAYDQLALECKRTLRRNRKQQNKKGHDDCKRPNRNQHAKRRREEVVDRQK